MSVVDILNECRERSVQHDIFKSSIMSIEIGRYSVAEWKVDFS